eukprot:CAMPEP_0194291140 /NCGR_PEP_ID=MMETSP0169-20130528/42837_1 /TAXON_ID=218684 /ORGANISM="Corethron pennatum, Strain L29A3" /LENGTH=372 /DNA_ID=CAMNT_0039038937 /DNA_START=105 /DNA_END=1223 /DNA_ORIENTATION=+
MTSPPPESAALLSLRYDGASVPRTLSVLDQLLLPQTTSYVELPDTSAAWSVIRSMQVRGAPLIAVVACLAINVEMSSRADASASTLAAWLADRTSYLRTSRPTAVNLFNAMDGLDALVAAFPSDGAADDLAAATTEYCTEVHRRDLADNRAIGSFGAGALLAANARGRPLNIMTVCNTGSLATSGYGTALGVARALEAQQQLKSVTALETRPYNQGSRLTAYEILKDGLSGGRLICDSMAASLMATSAAGGDHIDAAVVGADRICRNGDTANKIGTYQLAITCKYHGVPFYVAAPFSTIDVNMAVGEDIEIEERPSEELLESARAPEGVKCWNPAFDVTPADLITGIITEKGVITKDEEGKLDALSFVNKFK